MSGVEHGHTGYDASPDRWSPSGPVPSTRTAREMAVRTNIATEFSASTMTMPAAPHSEAANASCRVEFHASHGLRPSRTAAFEPRQERAAGFPRFSAARSLVRPGPRHGPGPRLPEGSHRRTATHLPPRRGGDESSGSPCHQPRYSIRRQAVLRAISMISWERVAVRLRRFKARFIGSSI